MWDVCVRGLSRCDWGLAPRGMPDVSEPLLLEGD